MKTSTNLQKSYWVRILFNSTVKCGSLNEIEFYWLKFTRETQKCEFAHRFHERNGWSLQIFLIFWIFHCEKVSSTSLGNEKRHIFIIKFIVFEKVKFKQCFNTCSIQNVSKHSSKSKNYINLYYLFRALEGLANRLATETDEDQKELISKQIVLHSSRSFKFICFFHSWKWLYFLVLHFSKDSKTK